MSVILTDCLPNLTNPFTVLLHGELAKRGYKMQRLSILNLFRCRADVVYLHWIEHLVCNFRLGWCLGFVAFVVSLLIAKLRHVPVVWHAHNISPHGTSMPKRMEKLLYRFFVNMIDGYVYMSPSAKQRLLEAWPALANKKSQLVRHGDYRDCYPVLPNRSLAREKLGLDQDAFVIGSFGVIKKYKNVEHLCSVFTKLTAENIILRIQGKCGDQQLRAGIEKLSSQDSRISYSSAWLSDAEYALEVAACDLIALPYSRILNSGNAIFALSVNTPVLVTSSAPMSDLRQEVGEDWVYLIDGELSVQRLQSAIDEVEFKKDKLDTANLELYRWSAAVDSLNTFIQSLKQKS